MPLASADLAKGKKEILKRTGALLAMDGFKWNRAREVVRSKGEWCEVVHFHQYKLSTRFRLHFCIRALADEREYLILNGPDSHSYQCPNSPNGRRYELVYQLHDDMLERCARECSDLIRDVGEPWFRRWSSAGALLQQQDSPLDQIAKDALLKHLAGAPSAHGLEITKKILKYV